MYPYILTRRKQTIEYFQELKKQTSLFSVDAKYG
jgi:hypothetical protein